MMSAFEKGHQWEMATWIYASKCCCFLKGTGSKVAKYMYIYIQSHGFYGFETSRFFFNLLLLVVFVVVVGCCWSCFSQL